jgi:hypothetical protein
LSDALIF